MRRVARIAIVSIFVIVALGSTNAGATILGPNSTQTTPASAQEFCGAVREPGEIAILGMTTPAVDQGTVRISELDLTSSITGGCFEFRHLTLPRDPMLISFEVVADGYRPRTWANWVILGSRSSPNLTPTLEPGDEPIFFDWCAEILATDPAELSAAQGIHAGLCSALPSSGLPAAGGGNAASAPSGLIAAEVLALVGAAFFVAGTAARNRRSSA